MNAPGTALLDVRDLTVGFGPFRAVEGVDLAVAEQAGMRFVRPGATEWPGQLDDLGDARPLGLWVRGRPSLRMWALKSVAVVGARACTESDSTISRSPSTSIEIGTAAART